MNLPPIVRFKFSIICHKTLVIAISSTAIYLYQTNEKSFSLQKSWRTEHLYGLLHLVGQHGTFHFSLSVALFLSVSRNAFLRQSFSQAGDHQVLYWFMLQTWVSCKFHVRPYFPSLPPYFTHTHIHTHTEERIRTSRSTSSLLNRFRFFPFPLPPSPSLYLILLFPRAIERSWLLRLWRQSINPA